MKVTPVHFNHWNHYLYLIKGQRDICDNKYCKTLGFWVSQQAYLSVYLINGFMSNSLKWQTKSKMRIIGTALFSAHISVSQCIHVADITQHKPLQCSTCLLSPTVSSTLWTMICHEYSFACMLFTARLRQCSKANLWNMQSTTNNPFLGWCCWLLLMCFAQMIAIIFSATGGRVHLDK